MHIPALRFSTIYKLELYSIPIRNLSKEGPDDLHEARITIHSTHSVIQLHQERRASLDPVALRPIGGDNNRANKVARVPCGCQNTSAG